MLVEPLFLYVNTVAVALGGRGSVQQNTTNGKKKEKKEKKKEKESGKQLSYSTHKEKLVNMLYR